MGIERGDSDDTIRLVLRNGQAIWFSQRLDMPHGEEGETVRLVEPYPRIHFVW